MFWLPVAASPGSRRQSNLPTLWPLSDHAALMLSSGLLARDDDDRVDKLRAALEIDPLLTLWTCLRADGQLRLLPRNHAALAEWLSRSAADVFPASDGFLSTELLAPRNRVDWQDFHVRTVAVARLSVRQAHLAASHSPNIAGQAYLLAHLGSAYHWLRRLESSNDATPIGRSRRKFPEWLGQMAEELSAPMVCPPTEKTQEQPTRFANSLCSWNQRAVRAVHDAETLLASGKVACDSLVGTDEIELWFRPLPEIQHLLAATLDNLRRLRELEGHFGAVLEQEKIASLREFAYGASHEINNPLANISTRAQTLLQSELDEDRRKKLSAINRQAFRAFDMLADLMLFAKPPHLQLGTVHLDDLLATITQELADTAAARRVVVHWQVADDCPTIQADTTQLAVVIRAICDNGLEAMADGGALELVAGRCEPAHASDCDKQWVELSIRDTGPGISPEVRPHLFDPFFSGREAGRGLGFGLCKAWAIIKQHDGEIFVESRLGQGATFRLRLRTEIDLAAASEEHSS